VRAAFDLRDQWPAIDDLPEESRRYFSAASCENVSTLSGCSQYFTINASGERQIELLRTEFQPFNGSEMLRREAALLRAHKSKNGT